MEKTKRVIETKEGIFILLHPQGPLMGELAQEFRGGIEGALAKGLVRVIVDLGAVPFIDSMSLEILCDFLGELRKKGGSLKIANPNEICRAVFYATRLEHLFEIYPNVDAAKRSFI
jgi:anti-anti-sigma factor